MFKPTFFTWLEYSLWAQEEYFDLKKMFINEATFIIITKYSINQSLSMQNPY